ncbi:MAG: hypothetical protein A4E53_02846 [Pelotomaculum sp. PtaB.Bin104]|nr:MAG: hypothetical protein A4E53_02846 [Pelotomaculum sp. PtaB.Bin104]
MAVSLTMERGFMRILQSPGRKFADGFLRIPPHGGHPCLKLTTTATFVVRDLHPIDNTHAGRTKIITTGSEPVVIKCNFETTRSLMVK